MEAWIRKIRKGDVLRSHSGRLRIVREVKHGLDKTWVTFSIQRCSWTTRAYTTYNNADLKYNKYRPTGKNVALNTEFDKLLEQDIGERFAVNCQFHCCDVLGIP